MKAEKISGRQLKQQIRQLLQGEDGDNWLDEIRRLPLRLRQMVSPLFSFLCSIDERVKWRAVTTLGMVVSDLAASDMESARVVMRRFIWNLNDESGGIGWGAPEAMAEIMACHQGLAKEYAHVLVSYIWEEKGNFLEYEMLQRGAVWGVGRLAESRPHLLTSENVCRYLLPYLKSKDATVRALAVRAIGLIGAEPHRTQIKPLLSDDSEIEIYLTSKLVVRRVSDLAGEALASH